jgi:hypothetical protein
MLRGAAFAKTVNSSYVVRAFDADAAMCGHKDIVSCSSSESDEG